MYTHREGLPKRDLLLSGLRCPTVLQAHRPEGQLQQLLMLMRVWKGRKDAKLAQCRPRTAGINETSISLTCGSVASAGGRWSREAKWNEAMAAARARATSGSGIWSALRQLHST